MSRVDREKIREIEDLIREKVSGHAWLPPSFALACAELESGFNPLRKRLTQYEQSYGLFQVNWNAHQTRCERMGASGPDALLDPAFNCEVWITIVKEVDQIVKRENPNAMSGEEWELVRLGLGGLGVMRNPTGPTATRMLAAFRPIWQRWREAEVGQSLDVSVEPDGVEAEGPGQVTITPLKDGGRREGVAPKE